MGNERGFGPIARQRLRLYVCITVGQCLANPGEPRITTETNAQGRANFEVSLTVVDQGFYVMIEAVLEDGIRCRLILTPGQLAFLASRLGLGAGVALGTDDGELNVDPLVEAAARILEDAGANSYDEDAIEALIDAVDTANANTRFDGLTLMAANDLAEMTAAESPAVQTLLQESRLCAGDCDADGTVRVNELVTGVNIALSRDTVGACAPLDTNASTSVTVDELVTAVNRLLRGCE